jgi:hypothetical protein
MSDDNSKIDKYDLILQQLEEIKTQTKLTNGRVTRLERAMLLTTGLIIGVGLVNWKVILSVL